MERTGSRVSCKYPQCGHQQRGAGRCRDIYYHRYFARNRMQRNSRHINTGGRLPGCKICTDSRHASNRLSPEFGAGNYQCGQSWYFTYSKIYMDAIARPYLQRCNTFIRYCYYQNDVCYTVTATNIYGCTGSGDICVKVLCLNSQVFVPNAFTPTGNIPEKQETMVRATGINTVRSFRVFNRWGKVVFGRRKRK